MDGCSGIRICGLCVRGDYFTIDVTKAELPATASQQTAFLRCAGGGISFVHFGATAEMVP